MDVSLILHALGAWISKLIRLRWQHRCYVSVVLLDGIIYAMGGFDGHHRLNTAEKYDFERNQWTMIAPMASQRSDACAAVLNSEYNYLYVSKTDQIWYQSAITDLTVTTRWGTKESFNFLSIIVVRRIWYFVELCRFDGFTSDKGVMRDKFTKTVLSIYKLTGLPESYKVGTEERYIFGN